MKTQWDYTDLAEAYLKRPDYSPLALNQLFNLIDMPPGARVCDIGAGVAHLTRPLLKQGFQVIAVEPNDAMRTLGEQQTQGFERVSWCEGTGEDTRQGDHCFDLVTFGSSFNVCDRLAALKESRRILKQKAWFACLWNHRNLEDPIQTEIELIIQKHVTDYRYGTRRESQTEFLEHSGLFNEISHFTGPIIHCMKPEDMVVAWRSHATLQRQAGSAFENIIAEIAHYLQGLHVSEIEIPYTTRLWCAQVRH